MTFDPQALIIYTDGSSQKGRRGGIGIRFSFPDFLEKDEYNVDIKPEGYKDATNIEMELKAAIIALERAKKLPDIVERRIRRVIVNTDLQFMIDNYPNACNVWPKTKWRKRDGSPVLNAQLWKELVVAARKIGVRVDFTKVRGHSNNLDNRAVDTFADESAQRARAPLFKGRIVRRKTSLQRTSKGSIPMNGQEITVRTISSRSLPLHKEFQLRCEVVEKNLEWTGAVDLIFSKLPLRPGHVYRIRTGTDQRYPQVEEVISEVEKSPSLPTQK
jgi:ribonuclease HI